MVSKNNNLEDKNLITIRGARQHNLKNLDLSLPRNKFTNNLISSFFI